MSRWRDSLIGGCARRSSSRRIRRASSSRSRGHAQPKAHPQKQVRQFAVKKKTPQRRMRAQPGSRYPTTHLAIDERLIEEARQIGNHGTKKEAVTAALDEYIRRRKLKFFRQPLKSGAGTHSLPIRDDLGSCTGLSPYLSTTEVRSLLRICRPSTR